MASQSPKTPVKNESRQSKRGINNPGIYAGTIVVLVIVIIAFVFMPMGGGSSSSISGSGRSLNFGSYDGKVIDYSQDSYMATQVRTLNDSMRQQGLSETNYQAFAYQVYRGAFERTVIRTAALDAVRDAGGSVTEDWLDKKVAESPEFQDNGKFSVKLYHDATLGRKLTVRNQIRDDALYQDYFSDIFDVSPSSKEIEFVKDMAKDTRTIQYAAIPLSSYPDSAVSAWATAHPALFRSLNLARITISTNEADAKKLLKNIQDKKTSFEDVAKASSKDQYAAKGGVMGAKYFYEISADLKTKDDAEKLAALKAGDISAVMASVNGSFYIFKCVTAAVPADLSQATVLASARSYITRSERGTVEDWAIARAKELAAAGDKGFEPAAKKAGIEVKSAGPFPINYGDPEISIYGQSAPLFTSMYSDKTPELAEGTMSQKFITAVFSAAPGSFAEPVVLGDYAIVAKVKEAAQAKDEATGAIGFYYPYFIQSKVSGEARDMFIKSPKLKDDFAKTFAKYFQPADTSAKK
jgi:PPIC-type PPIASE domain.